MTKIKLMLGEKLCQLYDDKDFVIGVLNSAVSDNNAQAILDYMQSGENVTAEDIILFALELDMANKAN